MIRRPVLLGLAGAIALGAAAAIGLLAPAQQAPNPAPPAGGPSPTKPTGPSEPRSLGHEPWRSTPQQVVFSPTGKWVATTLTDVTVRRFPEGTILWRSKAVQGWLGQIAFSPDSKLLVASQAGQAIVYEAQTGKELPPFRTPEGAPKITKLAFTSDGATLVGGTAKRVHRWDVATRTLLEPLDPEVPSRQHHELFLATASGRIFATGKDATSILVWDPEGRLVRKIALEGKTGPEFVIGLAPSPHGTLVAVTTLGRPVRVFDVATGTEKVYPEDSTDPAYRGRPDSFVAWSPDGKSIATGERVEQPSPNDRPTTIRDAETGEIRVKGKGSRDLRLSCLAFSPDGESIAEGRGPLLRIMDAKTGEVAPSVGHEGSGGVWLLAFDPGGETLISGGTKTLRRWDLATGRQLQVLTYLDHDPRHLDRARRHGEISPDGKNVVFTGLLLFDRETFAPVLEHPLAKLQAQHFAFSRDGKTIARTSGAYDDPAIHLHDTATGVEQSVLPGHEGIAALAFSPDGKTLASLGRDGVRVWDTLSSKELHSGSLPQGSLRPTDVAYSPKGDSLVTNHTGVVRLWDPAGGGLVRESLPGSGAFFAPLTFSPDGKKLALRTQFRCVLYDLERNEVTATFEGAPISFAFSPDGRTLACGYTDGALRVWPLD